MTTFSEAEWPAEAGGRIADGLSIAVQERGRASLCLAGGSTPEPVYRWLAGCGLIRWGAVEFFFGDERGVPPGHPESNFRMAREALFEPANIEPARVHRMEAERADRDAAADAYAACLPRRISVLVLGIGADGHTASLFPGSPALEERVRRVVAVSGPRAPNNRLTITPPVIEAAERIYVLARGEKKAEAVSRALEGPADPRECPARLARRGVWLVDEPAASQLTLRPR